VGAQAAAQMILAGAFRNCGLIRIRLRALATVLSLTRLDHHLDAIVVFPLNPRMSTGERVDV
jgi:hypothetical protein